MGSCMGTPQPKGDEHHRQQPQQGTHSATTSGGLNTNNNSSSRNSSNRNSSNSNSSNNPFRISATTHNSNTPSGGGGLRNSNTSSGTASNNRRRGPAPALSLIDIIDTDTPRPTAVRNNRQPIVTPSQNNRELFTPSVNGRNGWNVKDVYVDGIAVGKGTFGDVWKGTHKLAPARRAHERGEGWYTVAIKKTAPTVLDRRGGKRIWTYDEVEHLCQEVKTLLRLQEGEPSTSCILYLYEYYWTYNQSTGQGDLYLVTELLGQELDQWRQSQTSILESSVKQIASVLLNALDFLSSRQVAHRDLKLQNVLFRINGDFETLKIVDFGLAKVLEGKEKANDFCGSLGYIAPEIYMSKPYRYEVDMFAFGVMLFRLLSAQRPFSSPNPEKLRSDTINLRYKIEGKIWEGISPEALKLVRNLLIGPEQRYTAVQASNHRWFVAREDSVLYVDQHKKPSSRTNLEQHDGDVADQPSYSQVIALSHEPERPQAQKDGYVFWVEAAVETAVRLLLSQNKYLGRIVDEPIGERNAGLICLEETAANSVEVIPRHIANMSSYTEKDCRRLIREVALIVKQSHDNGMAHRNLLLTNIVVDRRGSVQIRGLQYAQAVTADQPLTGHFGYLYSWYAFKAPEIDSEFFHDKSVDLWSLGAALYMLLTALPPFRGDGVVLVGNKHSGNVVFDTVVPSRSSQQLVMGLLQPNPQNRLTIEEVLNSEWMNKPDYELESNDLSLTHAIIQDF